MTSAARVASRELQWPGPVRELWRKIGWLIALRWIAAGCLAAIITASRYLLAVHLPYGRLYLGNLVLLAANVGYFLYHRRLAGMGDRREARRKFNLFINLQIFLDLLLLTLLLHLAGGMENPFSLFFVFHMVIASILLPNRHAYLQATLAILLFSSMVALELFAVLPHHHLFPLMEEGLRVANLAYPAGVLAAFAATLYIAVYMSTSIVNTLRRRELDLEAAIRRTQAANLELEKKDLEKSRYVQSVSHDIKGSLGAIQSCLRVVLDGLAGTVGERALPMVARAERRSRELLRFAEELFYLSALRTEARLDKTATPLRELAEKAIGQLTRQAGEKGLEVRLQDLSRGAVVMVDAQACRQLLAQLLDNAVKYTPPHGEIVVRLQLLEDRHEVQVSVEDTGAGIAAADLPHLFEDFYSADVPENRETASTGLGLSIARQVAAMHGSTIEVESQPGKGSAFRFALALQSA